jgi:hypothetical protein
MYDSTSARDIPTSAQMVAGYVDGLYVWTSADWRRFPSATKVGIAVFAGTNQGDVLDVESGNATTAQAPGWLLMRRKAGAWPTIYASRSLFADLDKHMRAAGITDWQFWAAEWTGARHLLPGTYATQYDHPPHSGGHYDLSEVADYWPGIDPVDIAPPPPPVTVSGLDAARASWSNFATTVTQTIPQAIGQIAAAAASLGNDF